MLQAPLTLILGAGASRDFGPSKDQPFPLGDDLRDCIAKSLRIEVDEFGQNVVRGSRCVYSAYREASRALRSDDLKVGNLRFAGLEIARALPGCESIDDLLERHSGNRAYEIAAKLGIAENILSAERSSPLRQSPDKLAIPDIDAFSRHWLSKLLHTVTRGSSQALLSQALLNLKVVSFNYDRCFEWFLHLWIRHVYGVTQDVAAGLAEAVEIIHPYGSLGQLPNSRADGCPFGFDPSPEDLLQISQNILTYSESVEEDRRPDKIHRMTSGCERFIFVGFAFHEQNMKLLKIGQLGTYNAVYATTVGMPSPRWESAMTRIGNSLGSSRRSTEFYTSESSAADLVAHYGDRWTS